jgi:hypothetical protein
MYVIIDKSLPELAEAVKEEIRTLYPDDLILPDGPWQGTTYLPGHGLHYVELDEAPTDPSSASLERRLTDLRMALAGVRFWHNGFEDKLSPIYAGKPSDAKAIVRDAIFAEGKAKYLQSFPGVEYFGRTYISPRTVLLVDSPEAVELVVKTLPAGDALSPWSNTALVFAKDLRSLRRFVDDHADSVNFLAYDRTNINRLKKIGIDFGVIEKPIDSPYYGIKIRSTSAMMRAEVTAD